MGHGFVRITVKIWMQRIGASVSEMSRFRTHLAFDVMSKTLTAPPPSTMPARPETPNQPKTPMTATPSPASSTTLARCWRRSLWTKPVSRNRGSSL